MEEAADGKLAVVAWTIGRWRWMVAWEGGWSSGGILDAEAGSK
jgi:hypothetical protein